MVDSLRIEISLAKTGEWRVVERSHLAAESFTRVSYKESEVADVVDDINRCLLDANVNLEVQRSRLRRLGGRLAELVLPSTLRGKIGVASSPVEFFLDDASILLPVELFPNGDTVLADAVPVSRHWFCENALTPLHKNPDQRKQALIVADPAVNLPGALSEGEELYRIFQNLGKTDWHCRYLGRSVPGTELAKELPDTDLLHLAAHYVIGDGDAASGIIMSDGLWLPPPSSHTPELVFANCCRAGLPASGNGGLSLVGRFLQQGTRHVIAPFLPASDNVAKLFANAFYQELFSGKDVATAVWEAKKVIGPASWMYWYFGVFATSPITSCTNESKFKRWLTVTSICLLASLLILSGIGFYFRNVTNSGGGDTDELTTEKMSPQKQDPPSNHIRSRVEILREEPDLAGLDRFLREMDHSGEARVPGMMTLQMDKAAETGDIPAIELILSYGWPINGMDYKGNRPIFYALAAGKLETVEWLWRHGAELDKVNKHGTTPMHVAAKLGRVDIMQWLYDHGVDVNAKDSLGRTATGYAEYNKHDGAVQWLREKSARQTQQSNQGIKEYL